MNDELSIEARVHRLEAKRPAGVHYLVWGRDQAELSRVFEERKVAGAIRKGDLLMWRTDTSGWAS